MTATPGPVPIVRAVVVNQGKKVVCVGWGRRNNLGFSFDKCNRSKRYSPSCYHALWCCRPSPRTFEKLRGKPESPSLPFRGRSTAFQQLLRNLPDALAVARRRRSCFRYHANRRASGSARACESRCRDSRLSRALARSGGDECVMDSWPSRMR